MVDLFSEGSRFDPSPPGRNKMPTSLVDTHTHTHIYICIFSPQPQITIHAVLYNEIEFKDSWIRYLSCQKKSKDI
jgi:hypothetical protein